MSNRLLSICIPTYNRCFILNKMLLNLSKSIVGYEKYLEIIIFSNGSSDDTDIVVKSWFLIQNKNLVIKYKRNKINLGVSRNIISLLYKSNSKYFMFLGDDDELNMQNFTKIMHILKNDNPSAIIQTFWRGKEFIPGKLQNNSKSAFQFIYEYGNAWASIIDRQAAINSISSRKLKKEISNIVWPQLVFGYLAIHDLEIYSQKYIKFVNFEIGSNFIPNLNNTNKLYWIKSFADLLNAILIIQKNTNNFFPINKFLNLKSRGFIGHIKAIFWHTIAFQDKNSIDPILKILSKKFGLRGYVFSKFLQIDNHPIFLFYFLSFLYKVTNFKLNISLRDKINYEINFNNNIDDSNQLLSKRKNEWF